jgi:hypothetical protein
MAWANVEASLRNAAAIYARQGWEVELTIESPASSEELRKVPLRALRDLFAGSRCVKLAFDTPSGCRHIAHPWPLWDLGGLEAGFESWRQFAKHWLDVIDNPSTLARERPRVTGRLPLVHVANGDYVVCANDGTDVIYISHECGRVHGRQLAPTAEAFFERWAQLGAIDPLGLEDFLGRDGLEVDGKEARAWWRELGVTLPPRAKPEPAASVAIPYAPATRFAVGDRLLHPTFGEGHVVAARADRIDVRFADRKTRTLVHARA